MTKICVITGTRAEYGLLNPLMHSIKSDGRFQLQVMATGMHLSPEFGLTYNSIEEDGFEINEKVEHLLSSDTEVGIAKSTGLAVISITDALNRLRPDWVILLGDRFEAFAAATAAYLLKIPIIHLHGGELTEGATDDALRHAITKMSYLHFASAEEHRKRIIQLGESPDRVFNTGALGIDNIFRLQFMDRTTLESELNFRLDAPFFLVTYHPVTLEDRTSASQFGELLQALDSFQDRNVIFTLPNADADGRIIIQMIQDYVASNPERSAGFTSLGQRRYLSLAALADAIIGNSSSGIIEAPSLGVPTVNIGDRQRGRMMADSVINCGTSQEDVVKAINVAVSKSHLDICKRKSNPYGDGQAAQRMMEVLVNLPEIALKKKFYDI